MGKASKWIRNFLMGKREDKGKKTGPSVPVEACVSSGTPVVANTPKVRRRWSFKRSTSTKTISHKSSRSFDSIIMPKHALQEYQTRQNNETMPLKLNAHAAATKIQAAYRSYLARRALRALRGLVKLQALARGYLVRKKMNTFLRSIHAVMAIQVRARIHRIQMAEEPPVMVGRRKSYREPSASDRQLGKEIIENAADGKSFATTGGLKSRSGHHTPAERAEYGSRICASDRLSASRRDYKLKTSPTPSTLSLTDSSSTTYDGQLEGLSLKMTRRQYSVHPENKHLFVLPPSQCSDYMPSNSYFLPNYMTNTRSSTAKARSQSEPRQRPKFGTKQKSKRSSSIDGKNDKENQYPWLNNLYRSDKSTDDEDCDSNISAVASISRRMNSIIPFEVPPMNLY